jgi:hypothetical protein
MPADGIIAAHSAMRWRRHVPLRKGQIARDYMKTTCKKRGPCPRCEESDTGTSPLTIVTVSVLKTG